LSDLAKADIGLASKGHEPAQVIGGEILPFSDPRATTTERRSGGKKVTFMDVLKFRNLQAVQEQTVGICARKQ